MHCGLFYLDVMVAPHENTINKTRTVSVYFGASTNGYLASNPNLEQLTKTSGTVTDALDRHAGLVRERNKRAILSVR